MIYYQEGSVFSLDALVLLAARAGLAVQLQIKQAA
jgi:hypothetical protein